VQQLVTEGGGQLSIVLVGHPKLMDEMRAAGLPT
jgi:type II secretory pathway predicted ATPase ExeA